MYRPSADAPQFRPVPAAPPPPRMMGGPFISPPPSISPLGRPPIHAPMQGRPPVMQQYLYPPPAPQPPPPLLAPPPGALRTPLPLMHPSLSSMQSSLPSMQRPPLQLMRPSMPPSLPSVHSSRPLLPQPPAPVQAIFPSTQPSLPSVRPVSTQFQPSPQVQPPLSYVPAPLSSIQPAPFLPPLPPSPPSENPPPPPPPSPPPQPPPLPHIEEASSSVADLIPPEPPKPTDAEMLKNIDVLAAFVVKNGPRFESMARARQAGDPKFAFLFESDAAPEAAIGHEFYKWKKQSLALEFGLEIENKKNNQVEAGAVSGRILQGKATPGQPPLLDDVPASPAMSDMDMEDDFTPSPAKEPMQQSEPVSLNAMECGNSGVPTTECKATQSNAAVSATECMNDVPIMQDHELFDGNSRRASEEGMSWGRNSPSDDSEGRRNTLAGLDGKNLEALPSANICRDSSKRNHISNLIDADEHMQRDGRSGSTIDGDAHMGLEPSKSLQGLSDLSSEYTGVDRQRKLGTTDVSQEMRSERQERRMGRLSRWESVPRDTGDADTRDSLLRSEDGGGQKVEKSSSPRHDESFNNLQDVSVDRTTNIEKINREISENGRLAARAPLQPNQEAVSVDEFGRLVRKKATASDSDDDLRPQKRRRSFSRSRSGSRTRGRSRSRSRSRGRSRSRSRSPSYSPGESRWRRRSFSRSPPRRGRWSRSRSRSPHWQRNDSRSPSRDMRWGGMGRGVRDWRGERDSYGRGRREGRGSGPSICFHYARGRCFRGSACKFLHPEREIEQERGMQLADVQPPVFKDMEPAFTTHTSMTGAGSGLDPPHGIEDKCEVWRTESDRETNASSEAVYIAQGDRGRIQVEGLAPDREASDVWHDTAHAPKAAGTKDLSEAAKYAAKPFMSGEMEPIKNPAAALDLETVRAVDAVEKPDASKKTELAGELKVADRSDNGEIRLAAGSSEISESLKVDDNKGKDMDETLEAREGFATEMMLSEGDAKATKDPSEGASSPNQPSQLVVQERRDKEKVEVLSELKVLDKAVISAKKSDLISELEMLESEEIARRGSAESAIGKSDVGGEAHGQPNGSEASKTPLSPVPFLQANSMGKSMHMASPSVNQYISSEQRQGPVFAHQPLDSGHHPSPAANRLSPQLHSLAPPPVLGTFTSTSNNFSTGPFNPSHHLLNQGPSSISGNAGARHPFPMNNPSSGQQMSISNASQHGTLRSQPSHGSSFPSHLGFSQNPPQQSLLPPQDRMPNFALNQQPGQFSLNPPMLQGLGMAPYPAREPQESSAGFSLSKEDSAYARLFGENPRQYVHSNLSSDGLQHAYPRASIITSAAPTHSPLPWKDDSLAASRSMPVSSAEQPHYSYTLTTIPPLPTNLIKLPGGSSLPGSGEQYDPLSDVLDIGSSGALKALSGKPSGDGRSVGMGFLENVSPGLDSEKANILTPKAEIDTANTNEAATDVGVVENVSPPEDWSPVQAGEAAAVGHDQLHSKNKKSSRGLKLLRTAVADRVKVLLKPAWKEGRLSKDAFKTIAKKAVEKVTGNLPGHHIPKSQEKVDQFMAVSSAKITKLVQGYVDKYSKVQS